MESVTRPEYTLALPFESATRFDICCTRETNGRCTERPPDLACPPAHPLNVIEAKLECQEKPIVIRG